MSKLKWTLLMLMLVPLVAGGGGTLKLKVMTTPTTVPGVVEFPDEKLEAAVREAIGKPEGSITAAELARLTGLWAGGRGISDLSGLEYCTSLKMGAT